MIGEKKKYLESIYLFLSERRNYKHFDDEWKEKMIETLVLIVLASGIGLYHDMNKPTEYVLSMENGSNTHVVLQKNSQYACPLYCEVDHIHYAVICEDGKHIEDNRFVYHISENNESGFSFYCSTKKILSMTRLTIKKSKVKLPDVVSASTDE